MSVLADPAERRAEWAKRSGTFHQASGLFLPHNNSGHSATLIGPIEAFSPVVHQRVLDFLDPHATTETLGRLGGKVGRFDESLDPFFQDWKILLGSGHLQRMLKVQQVLSGPAFTTRGEHGRQVAAISVEVALATGLNPYLCLAAGYFHDMGHAPFGHAGEIGLTPIWRLITGDETAKWEHGLHGFRLSKQLGLTIEMAEAIGFHSWQMKRGGRLEGDVISVADRIAYVSSDLRDVLFAGLTSWSQVGAEIGDTLEVLGISRVALHEMQRTPARADVLASAIRSSFIHELANNYWETRRIGLSPNYARALETIKNFNVEVSWQRQVHTAVQDVQTAYVGELVEYFIPDFKAKHMSEKQMMVAAMQRVAAMTDNEALAAIETHLGIKDSEMRALRQGPPLGQRPHNTYVNVDLMPSKTDPLLKVTANQLCLPRGVTIPGRGAQPARAIVLSVENNAKALHLLNAFRRNKRLVGQHDIVDDANQPLAIPRRVDDFFKKYARELEAGAGRAMSQAAILRHQLESSRGDTNVTTKRALDELFSHVPKELRTVRPEGPGDEALLDRYDQAAAHAIAAYCLRRGTFDSLDAVLAEPGLSLTAIA